MINSQVFETLYGYDVKGKMKSWSIIVTDNGDHSVIKTDFGYVNGKMTTSLQTINTGKNIGKKNETTHYEQAISEAKSKWKKKSEQGYSTNATNNNATNNNGHVLERPSKRSPTATSDRPMRSSFREPSLCVRGPMSPP